MPRPGNNMTESEQKEFILQHSYMRRKELQRHLKLRTQRFYLLLQELGFPMRDDKKERVEGEFFEHDYSIITI